NGRVPIDAGAGPYAVEPKDASGSCPRRARHRGGSRASCCGVTLGWTTDYEVRAFVHRAGSGPPWLRDDPLVSGRAGSEAGHEIMGSRADLFLDRPGAAVTRWSRARCPGSTLCSFDACDRSAPATSWRARQARARGPRLDPRPTTVGEPRASLNYGPRRLVLDG